MRLRVRSVALLLALSCGPATVFALTPHVVRIEGGQIPLDAASVPFRVKGRRISALTPITFIAPSAAHLLGILSLVRTPETPP